MAPRAVSQLLEDNGLTWTQFLEEYFEKKPLVLKSESLAAPSLFSKQQLLQLVDRIPFQYDAKMTICKYDGQHRENFSPPRNWKRITSKALQKCFCENYSVQFYQPQQHVDALYALMNDMEEQFGVLAGCSAYLTPAKAQALAPHHDNVEVFVLQTEGKKHWKIYKPEIVLPTEASGDIPREALETPLMQLTLQQGDLLYLPRGFIHEAIADEFTFSTHVTISIYQYHSWGHLMDIVLRKLLHRAMTSDVLFREGLPIRFLRDMGTFQEGRENGENSEHGAKVMEKLSKLLRTLPEYLDESLVHGCADEIAADFVWNRLPPLEACEPESGKISNRKKLRLKNPSYIRIIIEPNEEGIGEVRLLHSLNNNRSTHMTQTAMTEDPHGPSEIAIPRDCINAVTKLFSLFPEFITELELAKDSNTSASFVRGLIVALENENLLEYKASSKRKL